MTEITSPHVERRRGNSTASSPKSSVAGDARDKMAVPKTSIKYSSRRSKNKDEVEEVIKKWESRFSQIESKLDTFFDYLVKTMIQFVKGENDDVVSLAPGHRERHGIGLLSEDNSSLKSETENPQKSSSRFSKYVRGAKSGTQRTVQRTSTVPRPDKDDKSSGTTNNFRRFKNQFYGKGHQKK
ncbi:unnamed protein product [Mytilus edulis]|uniref:Uncharacterized protein n=1 Tax=Mytilus edulis TaxID=6550 RepID=A0A8S3RH66_MYTED|nr:unnamed protein product [Mytilus edulis]